MLQLSASRIRAVIATVVLACGTPSLVAPVSAFAQSPGTTRRAANIPFLRRDFSYHVWHYDGRGDRRDFPTNGFFPGDFAADPAHAAIGAAGLFGSTPDHANPAFAAVPYPWGCVRQYRSDDAATGYSAGYDRVRRRCR